MHENEPKFFLKLLIALCILLAFGAICVMSIWPCREVTALRVSQLPTEEVAAITKSKIISQTIVLEELGEQINPYADLSFTDTEKERMACMAYSEAGNQPFDGQVAVVQVALNRYLHEAFDGSISDILFAPNQFCVGSFYTDEQMEAVEAALDGYPALDLNTDVVFFSTGALRYGSYYKTIEDHVFRTYT